MRQPWTVRVAAWSARHRWPVFGLWFLLTIGLFVASLAAGGTLTADAVDNDGENQTTYESARAYDVFNTAGTPSEDPVHRTLIVVGATDGPLADAALDDVLARVTAATAEVDGSSEPLFANIVDPRLAPPEAGLMSADRSTVRIAPDVPGEGEALDARLAALRSFMDELRAAYPDLRIHSLDGTLANEDIEELVNGGLDASLRLTIPLTFLILLVAFGAVVAAVVPLVLAITALLAAFGILGLYSQTVAPVSPYAGQLIVLIGLAVAVDYSLFMITRYRTERRHGRLPYDAIRVASATAGRAVFFSGLAVMFSVGGLFLLDDVLFRSMAVGTISVVLIAVIGSLDVPPGDAGDPRRQRQSVPGAVPRAQPAGGERRLGGRGAPGHAPPGHRVRRRGRRSCSSWPSPALRLHIGQCDFASFPDSIDSVQGINLLNEKWPEGSTLTLQVVVTKADEPATQAAIERLNERA